MNLVLFARGELGAPLSRDDPRAKHLLGVLRRRVGDRFDAGIIDGPQGKGTVVGFDEKTISLSFEWQECLPPPLDPVTLLVGLPRPQTARKILREATALGVEAIRFFAAAKGEGDYSRSVLWTSDEWRRHLISGAEQAFDTRLPSVDRDDSLEAAIESLPERPASRLALDVYDTSRLLGEVAIPTAVPIVLAVGSERGWSNAERARLDASGFQRVHLGQRVLRTETAVIATLGAIKFRVRSPG